MCPAAVLRYHRPSDFVLDTKSKDYFSQTRPGVFFVSRVKLMEQPQLLSGQFLHQDSTPASASTGDWERAVKMFIESLVVQRQWSIRYLTSVRGIRSLALPLPSAVWCFGAGHAWFHHPIPGMSRCWEPYHLLELHDGEMTLARKRRHSRPPHFDWTLYVETDSRCLRLSELGMRERPI